MGKSWREKFRSRLEKWVAILDSNFDVQMKKKKKEEKKCCVATSQHITSSPNQGLTGSIILHSLSLFRCLKAKKKKEKLHTTSKSLSLSDTYFCLLIIPICPTPPKAPRRFSVASRSISPCHSNQHQASADVLKTELRMYGKSVFVLRYRRRKWKKDQKFERLYSRKRNNKSMNS